MDICHDVVAYYNQHIIMTNQTGRISNLEIVEEFEDGLCYKFRESRYPKTRSRYPKCISNAQSAQSETGKVLKLLKDGTRADPVLVGKSCDK